MNPKQISTIIGDGAYDDHKCFAWAERNKVQAIFSPRKKAKIQQHGNSRKEPKMGDVLLLGIRKLGLTAWEKQVGYHRRSIVETAMYRFKTIFGDRLCSRKFENQWAEVTGVSLKFR